ncbi:MAG: hypothetical protein WA839_11110 [Flavobacteriaceae bacterium]
MINKNLEKENESNRQKASLTHSEWMTFFFLPFFTTKHRHRDDHFSESELERFKKYRFENKLIEAKKAKRNGLIFWFAITLIIVFILVYF